MAFPKDLLLIFSQPPDPIRFSLLFPCRQTAEATRLCERLFITEAGLQLWHQSYPKAKGLIACWKIIHQKCAWQKQRAQGFTHILVTFLSIIGLLGLEWKHRTSFKCLSGKLCEARPCFGCSCERRIAQVSHVTQDNSNSRHNTEYHEPTRQTFPMHSLQFKT